MQNRWIYSGPIVPTCTVKLIGEKRVGRRLEVAAPPSQPLVSAPAPAQVCEQRQCSKGYTCAAYGQTCKTSKDCTAESCCVVLDLDVINSNIPGRSLPEAFIAPCGSSTEGTIFCDKVCGRTEPDWTDFIDLRRM
jgi:hypothetical protein